MFSGYRVEDFVFEKIEKKRPNRLTNLEYLGLDMMEAGNVFGSSSPYGIQFNDTNFCSIKANRKSKFQVVR
jgi:endophilin-B1